MEQKENKQKTQAAEDQVSCPPQQPVEPHPFISVIPLAVLITLIVMVVKLFPDDALAGASQVALMIATAVCVALGMGIYNMKWNIFEEMIKKTVGDAGVSILILLLIGMMSATWMISGVVPTLIYYGVQIMSPTFFLPCACIISSIISVMTGTSWTTIATIGIALMGIGEALGIPAPYTAGAIISGAYFGDKLSPMSDTTVLASSIAGADLFSHIRYMLYTTIPSILLSLVLYLIIGLCYDSKPVDISQYLTGLSHGFNISLLTMLVPAFTGWLIYRKTPSLITLLLSALSACICALILQPEVLVNIAGEDNITAKNLFEGIMITCYTHTQVDCGGLTSDHAEIKNILLRLRPYENKEQMFLLYQKKKKRWMIGLIVVGIVSALYVHGGSQKEKRLLDGNLLVRNVWDAGNYQVDLNVKTKEWNHSFSYLVKEKAYTREEAEQLYRKFAGELPSLICGENQTFQEVTEDLKLANAYKDYPFTVSWSSTDQDRVSSRGK